MGLPVIYQHGDIMSTTNLRQKINALENMIQADDIQMFQAELIVAASETSTGDPQVDQAMKANAMNASAQAMQCKARLAVYRGKLIDLQAEMGG